MADRKPLKVLPDGGGDSTGLGEFVAADTVGIVDGGTGLATVGSNQLLTGNGTSALTSESNLTFDGNDLFIANGGGMVIGHTSQLSPVGYPPELQVLGTGDADTQLALVRYSNSGSGTQFSMTKSRNASIGGSTIVQDDDQVGIISWNADDGTTTDSRVAAIEGYIDGTPGVNDMPGRLVFSTTADGATSLTERLRIDASGRVGIGMTPTATLQLKIAGNTSNGISIQTTEDGGTDEYFKIGIGTPSGYGASTIFTRGGADGFTSETMRLTHTGLVAIGTSSTAYRLKVADNSASQHTAYIHNQNASYTGGSASTLYVNNTASAGTGFNYLQSASGNASVMQFNLRGDGTGQSNISWTDNSIDYAEYFESATGAAAELGRAVVLADNKVRYYDASTDDASNIIGITRPKKDATGPSAHGMAWNHWHNRFLTDDYGQYIMENVTVWEWGEVKYADGDDLPEGKEVGDVKIEAGSCYERDELAKDSDWTPPTGATRSTQSVRKENPDYDESQAENYKSREDRDEWWLIGLLGQVPVNANEPTHPNWIKMKQISDAVDLWLVR